MSAAPGSSLSYQGASPEAIAFHYDLGNDFYRCWLDERLVYSCALYDDGVDPRDLAGAQVRKLDHHLSFLGAGGGGTAHSLLDIGCGWGGALVRARDAHGYDRLTGLSLSRAQLEDCRPRLPGADLRYENWFEHTPASPYDAIVSIEAFEAFAKPGLAHDEKVAAYRAFFERCAAWLRPEGRLALQVITYGTLRPADLHPMLNAEIFPDSDLPTLDELIVSSAPYFEIVRLQNRRHDYVRTLKSWARNLRQRREAAVSHASEERVVAYLTYLNHSQLAFATGGLHLFTVHMQRHAAWSPRAK